jgi:2-keto-4-pentenoate hydratase/2-oxohepta-3-ene-1,7-dioic acid hydratase in catechol pathway
MKMPLPEEPILFLSFNDVTARDLQRKDGQWTRSKSFAPFGPWIAKIDPSDVDIETRVNGKVMQFISGVMTLELGDVILSQNIPLQ